MIIPYFISLGQKRLIHIYHIYKREEKLINVLRTLIYEISKNKKKNKKQKTLVYEIFIDNF